MKIGWILTLQVVVIKNHLKIRSQLNESKKSKLIVTGNCEYPHRQFSGAWICNLNTKTFVQKFPFYR
jgi:hypothetical protein